MKHSISLIINGDPVDAIVKDNLTLLDFLRDQLFLTGTKKGCEEGECGACTVMLDGKPVNSCCTLAVECDGHEIITVEGIAREGMLHPHSEAVYREVGHAVRLLYSGYDYVRQSSSGCE